MRLVTAREVETTIHPATVANIDARARTWFPQLAVIAAAGLALVAIGDTATRSGNGDGEILFWVGLLGIYLPIFGRLLSRQASDRERSVLVAVLGLLLYLVKVLHSPHTFTAFDEFSNWRTVHDIQASHHLFRANPLLDINPYFPGLGIVTSALTALAGASIFLAGNIIIGAAKVVLVLALYALYTRVAGSARIGGLAAALYMANPDFLFFDSHFAYESLALPLAAVALLLFHFATSWEWKERPSGGLLFLGIVTIAALTVTHHATSYFLVLAFLILTALAVSNRVEWPTVARRAIWSLAAVASVALWTAGVAETVIPYLSMPVSREVTAVVQLLSGHHHIKHLFGSAAATASPLWEQLVAYGSVLAIVAATPLGYVRAFRDRRFSSFALGLYALALAYPLTLFLRFTAQGTETSRRASEFVFIGLAYVLALAAVQVGDARVRGALRSLVLVGAAVMMTGGVVLGVSPLSRMPGPFRAVGGERSIGPENIAAAYWMRRHLGHGNAVFTDYIDRQLLGSYGLQNPNDGFVGFANLSSIFFHPKVTEHDLTLLKHSPVRYIEVDDRIAGVRPEEGFYFNIWEPTASAPLTRTELLKLDRVPCVDVVYATRHIRIYDLAHVGSCQSGHSSRGGGK